MALDRDFEACGRRVDAPGRGASGVTSRVRGAVVVAAIAVGLGLCVPVGQAATGVLPRTSVAPGARVPGEPVPPVEQFDISFVDGQIDPGDWIPATAEIGEPDPGVVPVIGDAAARADDGAFVYSETRVDERVVDLVVKSPAVGGYAPVRVMLPTSWGTDPDRRYPVVYLLHGSGDNAGYQSWSVYVDLESIVGDTEALVVMPSTGGLGYVTDYRNFGLGGAAGWQLETYVAEELPQILHRGYRAGDGAAVAGLSSGGYSAISLAVRRPDQYDAVASFSGPLDTQLPVAVWGLQFAPLAELDIPTRMWGDPVQDIWTWRDHNPAVHTDRLRGKPVFVSAGNGEFGPLMEERRFPVDPIEPLTLAGSVSFVEQARAAGVNVHSDFYGDGTHTWPYWRRGLARAWPLLTSQFG